MIKHGGISCSVTNADTFLWKLNFFCTKNCGEGSVFPDVPLCLFHLSFFNTPLAHFSVITRLPLFQESRVVCSNYACCCTYKLTPVNDTSSNSYWSLIDWFLQLFLKSPSLYIFFWGIYSGSDEKALWIFHGELFNCWFSTEISFVYAELFFNIFGIIFHVFIRTLIWLWYLIFSESQHLRTNIFCRRR